MSADYSDILGSSVELSTEPVAATEPTEPEKEPVKEYEPIESLSEIVEKADDRVPLKKYMEEKRARQELEEQAQTLAQELERVRNSGIQGYDTNFDVDYLSQKHNIDADVLRDIINATSAITSEAVRAKVNEEIAPALSELTGIKREKEQKKFDDQFNKILSESIEDMPEYKDLIDKDDLKEWIRSGKYSKLTMPQLIEQKYGKFVGAKKTIDGGYTPGRESSIPDPTNMTDEDWVNIDKNPDLKKKWQGSLEDRLRKFM